MKNRSQLLYTIVGFFVIFGLVISMNSNSVFAEEDKVFYLDELSKGNFIPNDSTIIVGSDYTFSSNFITNKVRFSLGNTYNDRVKFDVNSGESFDVEDYKFYFPTTTDEYEGWVVERFNTAYTYEIQLYPSNKVNDVELNDTEIKINCEDNGPSSYNWYKITDFSGNIELETPDESLWNNSDGLYSYSLNNYKTTDDLTSQITLNFNAKKDELLFFEYKSNQYLYYSLNGVSNYLDFSSNVYSNSKIQLTNTGSNEMVFTDLMSYENLGADNLYDYSGYLSLRNIRVLSYLNEGSKLDTSKVSNGDEIYYECNCEDGYKYSNSFRYESDEPIVEKEASNDIIDKDNSVDKNPSTYSNIIVIIFVVSIILFSTYINRGKLFRKDS